jgi:penicillin G amidase
VEAKLERNENGIFHIRAASDTGRAWGLGYAHGRDRAMQMLFMRLLGRGELSKYLDSSDEALEVDTFFRRMNWSEVEEQEAALPPATRTMAEAYCAGVREAMAGRVPWELRLAGYRELQPWTVADSLLLARMISYLTLAQSQGEMERLLVQMVQAGVSRELLEELFPGQLKGLDEELVAKVELHEELVPESVKWLSGGLRLMASNNWVVAPQKTASGKAMLANDPHLEINRLPAVWYEVVIEGEDNWAVAATMPGILGLITARTKYLSWGPTYAFMDSIDSWVEHCKAGQYRRGDDWCDFRLRSETIERKGKAPCEVVFYENAHGVLDGDPRSDSEQYLLSTRWASAGLGAASFESMVQMWSCQDVATGMRVLSRLENAFSWVLADAHGNIGFQMSGLMPKRKPGWSGLVPLPGWDGANDWKGMVAGEDLPRCLNPAAGYFVTANQDLNSYGNAKPINVHQGDYRARRLRHLLEASDAHDLESMAAMQMDLKSEQAMQFMDRLKPLLPVSAEGRALLTWDCRYTTESLGASLFEAFYEELLREVFGEKLGPEVVEFLWGETGMFADFFSNFDRVLLAETSSWFVRTWQEHYRRAAERALKRRPLPYGRGRELRLAHILFGDKLPLWLGFDRGPIQLPGGRATPHQGQIYRSAGRTTSFAPSIRFISDFESEGAWTRLVGGVSDRRGSPWYCNELSGWLAGTYKRLEPRGH